MAQKRQSHELTTLARPHLQRGLVELGVVIACALLNSGHSVVAGVVDTALHAFRNIGCKVVHLIGEEELVPCTERWGEGSVEGILRALFLAQQWGGLVSVTAVSAQQWVEGSVENVKGTVPCTAEG